MIVLAILFGWIIVMHGGGFSSMQGGVATDLEVSGSWIIPYVPWVSLVIYIAAVALIRRDQKIWRRWAFFAVVTVLCNTVIGYPLWIYDQSVHRIALSTEPSRELRAAFEARFGVKAKWYSNSSEGNVLAVKNTDFSEDMVSYLKMAEQAAASDR